MSSPIRTRSGSVDASDTAAAAHDSYMADLRAAVGVTATDGGDSDGGTATVVTRSPHLTVVPANADSSGGDG